MNIQSRRIAIGGTNSAAETAVEKDLKTIIAKMTDERESRGGPGGQSEKEKESNMERS